jgi:hypothetical protein
VGQGIYKGCGVAGKFSPVLPLKTPFDQHMGGKVLKSTRGDKPSSIYTNLYNLYNSERMAITKAQRLIYPIDLTDNADDLNMIAEKLRTSKAEAIRGAIKHYAEYLGGLEVVTYRDISKGQARREIQKYLKGKSRVSADEISDALRIDIGLVNKALLELWGEGWVEPER